MEDEKSLIRFFTQCPHLILYGLPDVALQDKWALLALIGMCWDRSRTNKSLKELEGPYKLTTREIAAITGVKHNALRKTEGKDPRTGVLDRLQELGYVTAIDARPINDLTGKAGRVQTYLYIHLEKIWLDNAAFTENWHMSAGKMVDESSFERVVEANTVHVVNNSERPVIGPSVNNNGHEMNNKSHQVNNDGHEVNPLVHGASSKSGLIHSNTNKTKEEKEDTLSSSNQKANAVPFLRMFMRTFLLEMEQAGNLMDKNLAYLQEVYYASGLDKESFRFKAENAISRTRQMKGNIDYFYDYLCKSLGIPID